MKITRIVYGIIVVLSTLISSSAQAELPNTLWAKIVAGSNSAVIFYSVTTDASGNVYTAGYKNTTEAVDFGNNVTVSGTQNGQNALLVKYQSTTDKSSDNTWIYLLIAGVTGLTLSLLSLQ